MYLLVNVVWMSLSHRSVHIKNPHVASGQLFHAFFYTDRLPVPWKWWMLQNLIDIHHTPRKCDGWGCLLLASHHTGPCSVSGHYVWDVLWTKWHWVRFFSEYLSFPPLIIIPPMPHAHSLMHHWYTNRKPHSSLLHHPFYFKGEKKWFVLLLYCVIYKLLPMLKEGEVCLLGTVRILWEKFNNQSNYGYMLEYRWLIWNKWI